MSDLPCIQCAYFGKKGRKNPQKEKEDIKHRKSLIIFASIILFFFLICIISLICYSIYLIYTPWILFPEQKNNNNKETKSIPLKIKQKKQKPSIQNNTNLNLKTNVKINNLCLNQGLSWTNIFDTTSVNSKFKEDEDQVQNILSPNFISKVKKKDNGSIESRDQNVKENKKKNTKNKNILNSSTRNYLILNDENVLKLILKYLSNQHITFTEDLLHSFVTEYKTTFDLSSLNESNYQFEQQRIEKLIYQSISSWKLFNKLKLMKILHSNKQKITDWLQ